MEHGANDASKWRLISEYMTAHWNTSADSSSYYSHGNNGTTSYQQVAVTARVAVSQANEVPIRRSPMLAAKLSPVPRRCRG